MKERLFTGWLLYDSAGARRNEWFIHRLQTVAAREGISLDLRLIEDIKAESVQAEKPDFAIVRSIAPHINQALEAQGVRVFNNALTAKTACDKWETYMACKRWGIPVLPTVQTGEATAEIGYPCIVKTVDGHGGEEVFRAQTESEYLAICQRLSAQGKRAIAQKQNAVLGKDMRIYAVNGEIIAGGLRESDSDFRSNFSLGGRVTLRAADEEQKGIVKELYKRLQFDFIGVDFLPQAGGGWVLNEIEDSAGARMLYSLSDIDIAERMIQHVKSALC